MAKKKKKKDTIEKYSSTQYKTRKLNKAIIKQTFVHKILKVFLGSSYKTSP